MLYQTITESHDSIWIFVVCCCWNFFQFDVMCLLLLFFSLSVCFIAMCVWMWVNRLNQWEKWLLIETKRRIEMFVKAPSVIDDWWLVLLMLLMMWLLLFKHSTARSKVCSPFTSNFNQSQHRLSRLSLRRSRYPAVISRCIRNLSVFSLFYSCPIHMPIDRPWFDDSIMFRHLHFCIPSIWIRPVQRFPVRRPYEGVYIQLDLPINQRRRKKRCHLVNCLYSGNKYVL